MNNSNSNEPSKPKNIEDSSRGRNISESSCTSDDGAASGFAGRRQRTTSQSFMNVSGITSASPPKFVSLEEIMQAANGMKDMNLVHQIAVDDNFKLEKSEPPPDTIERIIKETMHKAFWDKLRLELAEEPPNYNQALILLEEVKEGLLSLLLPQHTKIKQHICEVLDVDLIKQQAEKGVLNFEQYARFVITIMSKLCAPVRDEKINELKEITDVVETFRNILETLDLMKLDMANFTLAMAKPDIIAHSVELERRKFAEFLAVQPDGLRYTRQWLLKHIDTNKEVPDNVDYESFLKSVLKNAFLEACIDLIDCDEEDPYPETFVLDQERLYLLTLKTFRLTIAATVLLVSLSNAGPDLQSIAAFKQSLKEHILILLQNIKTKEDVEALLPNIAEQVISEIKEAKTKYEMSTFYQAQESNLKQQILDIAKSDHKIKGIVKQRVKDFFLDIIESSTAAPQKVPTGLTAFQKELTEIAGQFLRIVSHNRTVFSNYYYDIVAAALPKPK